MNMHSDSDLGLVLDRILGCDLDIVVAGHGLAILDAGFGLCCGSAVVVERENGSSKGLSHSASPYPSDPSPGFVLVLILELAHTPAAPCPLAYP